MEYSQVYLIIAITLCFLMTWGVGANDLANVMSTTMGSKAVSVKQAMLIAVIFEFAGAFLGGTGVTETMRDGIINTSQLSQQPLVLIEGMLGVLLACTIWMNLASYFGLPVSITNALVGSMVGFGSMVLGADTVHWNQVYHIAIGWITSPLIAGVTAYFLFFTIQQAIFVQNNPLEKAKLYMPIYLFMIGSVLSFITVFKGLTHFNIHLNFKQNLAVTLATSITITIIGMICIRRIAEHGRAMTMLVSDGVLPSNEGRGYVLRRIIRRAILAARRSGSDAALTSALVDATLEKMGGAYPVLLKDRDLIKSILEREEAGFARTLRTGMSLLEEARHEVESTGATVFPGEVAFRLHDTHGFPIELTSEIVAESGLGVDRAAFDAAMSQQRERARANSKALHLADEAQYRELIEAHGTTEFVGRDASRYSVETTALAILVGDDGTSELFLESTPFYAESGGQVGDTGTFVTESGRFEILDTQNVAGGLFAHRGRLVGEVLPGQVGIATIDPQRREATRRNHTATHLLHSSLRSVLGDHVRQQGSYVGPERLRFDFSHGTGLRPEEAGEILALANRDVVANEGVETIETTKTDAEKMGAIAFFGDKYGDRVRVVRAGSHSLEFCGGTHVDRLGDIGQIQIVSEASIGANTRRIEAVSAMGALRRSSEMEATLSSVATLLKTSQEDVVPSLERLFERQREMEKEVAALRQAQLSHFADQLHASSDATVLVARVDGYPGEQLRTLAQDLQRRGRRAVVIAGASDGKVSLAVASDDSLDAQATVKRLAALVGGGGGGSARLALAGGRDLEGIDRVLAAAQDL